jgi:putative N-acetylmannosamine-6-phosphate epimerase
MVANLEDVVALRGRPLRWEGLMAERSKQGTVLMGDFSRYEEVYTVKTKDSRI